MAEQQTPTNPGREKAKQIAADRPDMKPGDEAPPGAPGTGEAVDPKTGETETQGIGGG